MNIREMKHRLKNLEEHISKLYANIQRLENSEDLDDFRELKNSQDLMLNLLEKKNNLIEEIEAQEGELEKVEEEYNNAVSQLVETFNKEAAPFLNRLQAYLDDLGPKFLDVYETLLDKDNQASSAYSKSASISGKSGHYMYYDKKNHFYFKNLVERMLQNFVNEKLEERKREKAVNQ
jgi:DNA repair exonuclease SbcCD ATPase subunit